MPIMEVVFASAKMQKLCNSATKLRGKYGSRMATLIGQRLFELSAADTLADMCMVHGARCHPLRENLKGLWAVDLVQLERLVFRPANDPLPKLPDDGLDAGRVTAIEVVAIGNYHK
jgi:proteic killer suppression protein